MFPNFYSQFFEFRICLTVDTTAMPFDWQAELAVSASLPSVPVRIIPTAAASTLAIVTVAQVITAPPKSFAAAVGGSRSPPTEEPPYPVPCIKGDSLSIRICQDEYVKGLEDCQYALCGRLILYKGDKPYTARDLASKLGKIWKMVHQWFLLVGVSTIFYLNIRMTSVGFGQWVRFHYNHDSFASPNGRRILTTTLRHKHTPLFGSDL